MTDDDVRGMIAKQTGSRGMSRWCRKHGLLKSRVSEFMNGIRPPNDALLAALNLEYRIVRKSGNKKACNPSVAAHTAPDETQGIA